MQAIHRMELREPPETTDVKIVKPILVDLATELNKDDPIRFTQIGCKFLVDVTEFRVLLGFGYLQELLKNAGQFVACTSLSPISKQVVFEPVAERGVIHKNINRKSALEKKLRWMKHQSDQDDLDEQSSYEEEEMFQVAEELLKIGQFLSGATHAGKIKHIHNDYDRNRQSVCKAMRLAISYLEDHPDTAHIGQHLQQNTKFGAGCRYFGDWKWIL